VDINSPAWRYRPAISSRVRFCARGRSIVRRLLKWARGRQRQGPRNLPTISTVGSASATPTELGAAHLCRSTPNWGSSGPPANVHQVVGRCAALGVEMLSAQHAPVHDQARRVFGGQMPPATLPLIPAWLGCPTERGAELAHGKAAVGRLGSNAMPIWAFHAARRDVLQGLCFPPPPTLAASLLTPDYASRASANGPRWPAVRGSTGG
jgi:hypothetical protein